MRSLGNQFLFSLSVFLGVYTLLFFLIEGLSIDSSLSLLGENASDETRVNLRKFHHLDLSMRSRYFIYLNNVSPISIYSNRPESPMFYNAKEYNGTCIGSIDHYLILIKWPYLGRSYQNQERIEALLWSRFQVTLILSLISIFISTVAGIFLGILAARFYQSRLDSFILFLSSIGVSSPSFFVAIFLAIVFGYYTSEWTGLSFKGSLFEYTDTGESYWAWRNLILPIAAISCRPIAMITQMTRNAMLEVLQEDYIRTAYSKGLSKAEVFFKHAFFNALNPIITSVSSWFAALLGGAYFIEIIFDMKGLGSLTVHGLMKLDVPVVFGSSLLMVFLFLVISNLVDILYRIMDPRMKK